MNHFLKPLILFLVAGFISSNLQAQNARIKIDLDRTIGEVNKNIYGNFVEHLGRCVYGGIYDPDSPFADEDGFRTDVLEAARDLNIPIVRYPGGNFVSNYNWKDGVGPERTKRLELAWARLETNEVGTNEFMKWANKLGTEPYFAVNLGTGTIREARQWVEYCNVKEGPYYAELRKKHGFPEPYNIKYWSLGNEMDGYWQMGHLNAIDYSKKAREAGKLMRLTSPGIKLIAAGSSNYRPDANPDDWNRTVLEELKDYIDYIALHIYVGNPDNNYYNFMATPLVIEERTRIVEGMINEVMQRTLRRDHTDDPIYIAWDEYNVWYRARSGDTMTGERALEEHYNLEDALVIGGMLNAFIRNAHIVKMANMAQLVNVIGPIFTSKDDMYKQTIYYPLELFANNMHGTSLDVFVDCETYDTEEFYLGLGETTTQQSDVPYLDVSATYKDDNVTIAVINRHKDKAIPTDIISQSGDFDGKLEVYEINGPDIKAENDFGQTNVKTERKENIKASGSVVTYAFPPHSVTLLKGKIKQ
ncbi:MAG: alpha-N-arabinofuranosidase [Anaerophaga sp.]|uniref:alpha-N-arabinofuranosidase n=1 Tax=Anaerophaga thermohalophila TaxID=177400 RepID=UPI001FE14D56|nr:alpha-L-arabinofuranosidase C-terminal domain-containing protein [Anaerophaga thermohalophila]MBZ4677061.1 alpha-N-arabinofuranosidase [Anaerophaga sp.]MDI3520421.1 alpha-L-arabinofuranosidase [Anaerophaga sp.]MDK2842278.1 alpha-L-arabinofuranosidase [Anaerophaga sp.]MDN5290691.1 alpha-L-arabinofuranosidase [Anaerophaga sp.]